MSGRPFALLRSDPKVRAYVDRLEARLREVEAERDEARSREEWLTEQLERQTANAVFHFNRADAAEAEVERLRETLLLVEQDSYGRCPVCDAYDPRGHREAGHGNVHGLSCSIGIAVHPRAALASPPSVEPKETGE